MSRSWQAIGHLFRIMVSEWPSSSNYSRQVAIFFNQVAIFFTLNFTIEATNAIDSRFSQFLTKEVLGKAECSSPPLCRRVAQSKDPIHEHNRRYQLIESSPSGLPLRLDASPLRPQSNELISRTINACSKMGVMQGRQCYQTSKASLHWDFMRFWSYLVPEITSPY